MDNYGEMWIYIERESKFLFIFNMPSFVFVEKSLNPIMAYVSECLLLALYKMPYRPLLMVRHPMTFFSGYICFFSL